MADRRRIKLKHRSKPGTAPGQIAPLPTARQPRLEVIGYGPAAHVTLPDADLATIEKMRADYPFVWINVEEFGDARLIEMIGHAFGLHRLALEDAVNTHQRPKVEEYDDHLFVVARMLVSNRRDETEQVAFFLGKNYLITFQEVPGDCFGAVRARLTEAGTKVRTSGPDYLLYALMDSIVDEYFPVLERIGEELETLEDAVVRNPTAAQVNMLHDMKRTLLMLRRVIWPQREMISSLLREDHGVIAPGTRTFLRDVYDHTIQLMDIVETYREIASGLVDLYMSSVNIKLSEVMKVLTIVATVFMPLSFIASLYGMNFEREKSPWNMPELGWYYGYPFALSLMVASATALIWYCWRKGWIFESSGRRDGSGSGPRPPKA